MLYGVGSLAALGSLAGCIAEDADNPNSASGAGGQTNTATSTENEQTATATAEESSHALPSKMEAWLSDANNYDGVTDMTGQQEVTITVGASSEKGAFAFDPPVAQIDPGTTVTWEWVAGKHKVAAEDGDFESELYSGDEKRETFQQTFQETGAVLYYCLPHKAMGMKGALVVGDISDIDPEELPTPEETHDTPDDHEEKNHEKKDHDDEEHQKPVELVDKTGQDEVTVQVGGREDHPLRFWPEAIRIDPGTTVVWEWTGEGGAHNVVAEDGSFRSGDPVAEAGTTFEYTFDSEGVTSYVCRPHKAIGMTGVVVVGDVEVNLPYDHGEPPRVTPTPNTRLDAPQEVQQYLHDVDHATEVDDATGQETVTIQVGAENEHGPFAFSPPAVRIDAGTTVVWEWAGDGGAHNVVAEDDSFESGSPTENQTAFEQTFSESGTVLYYCAPHKALGMKGAIIVE